jgi:predicted nucleotidyltransferase
MPNLYTIATKNKVEGEGLSDSEVFSVVYHDIFDYPLSFPELIKWKSGKQLSVANFQFPITKKNGFYFLEGREGLIYKRVLRDRISKKKLEIAEKAARILSFVPGIKMVAVTGSLSMGNSTDESDIDLLVITKKGALWTTRLLSYFLLSIMRYALRRPADANQKDKLCLNIWIDEADIVWKKRDRNVYSAHEIGQILPLINKDKTYEKFLQKNRWILDYWPSAVVIKNSKFKIKNSTSNSGLIEKICYWIQRQYMKPKVTREVVTSTRALFHPQDWGKIVLSRLSP